MSLNLIACAFIIIWMVEYLGYNAGKNIHVVLLIGVLFLVARLCLLIPLRKRV